MQLKGLRALTALAALAVVGSANAFVWTISAPMDGLQETPPVATPASGLVTGTFDDVTMILTIDTSGQDFLAPVSAAHIHNAPAGSPGPVVFPLSGTTGGMTYTSHDMFALNAAQAAQLLAGDWYVNIHSTLYPGGEIRGQLNPVPEPATMIALASGIGIVALRRRRKA